MVSAREEEVVIPTYPVPEPDRNPMFLDKRVYQGSSGKVYPNPVTDRVADVPVDKVYRAVFLENEFIRLMILPEIGGRIHVGQDKTNGYDFFYRQNVIKPALVGLLGPWISGGVEFNWPQHHRPSTFMPVDYAIQTGADGSATVWLSEHEPMQRMKGMVGIRLYPGKALIEANVRLYNRTGVAQTFLWWANVGIRVHDRYQAIFPPDVHFVADHARRAVTSFPMAHGRYYGVNYAPGTDLRWYKNIPVPTSYMVTDSQYDFFGGYDFAAEAGMVHFANRHIAPGKKLWTWGNAGFGYAWDRNLTDSDGPYIELMAGVYTDNQPDFSWLAPYETKTFRQCWYPIQRIGGVKNANREAAINLEIDGRRVRAGVCVTEARPGLRVELREGEHILVERTADVSPGVPLEFEEELPSAPAAGRLTLRAIASDGSELIRWSPEASRAVEPPAPADEPPPPSAMASNDELYLTGLHLEQYRHATRAPETYWEEAVRRDAGDSQSNIALGVRALRRGDFAAAELRLGAALGRLTRRNRNPERGDASYYLGLALRYQGRLEEARAAFYKATWNYAWRGPAHYALAELACREGNYAGALAHVEECLVADAGNLKARDLKSAVLRRVGRTAEAGALAGETLALDALDWWARHERALADGRVDGPADAQVVLDLAIDYLAAGLTDDAATVLEGAMERGQRHPMLFYVRAALQAVGAEAWYERARSAPPDYCFPHRLDEQVVLEQALERNPADARASYYLGNLLYDKGRGEDAIRRWEAACQLDPGFPTAHRNLGIAYFNLRRDPGRAMECFRRAFEANPRDGRVLYELDQLRKRVGAAPDERLRALEAHAALVETRDDLTVELATLYNHTGDARRAYDLLTGRKFHPWEGGEGLVAGEYARSLVLLGLAALDGGDPGRALGKFTAAREYPESLGEGKHLLKPEADLDYLAGDALAAAGRNEAAQECWRRAAECDAPGAMIYYRALALARLGECERAAELLRTARDDARERAGAEVKIDYFATSLPNFLLFEDDLERRNRVECRFLEGLALAGLGQHEGAAGCLADVLAADPNHTGALDFTRRIGARRTAESV